MNNKNPYHPPFTITPAILRLVAEVGEAIGRYSLQADNRLTPRLRRENRIRTIHASLAIENNTLSLEQVTAVIDGKRVLGHPREVQEVRNAFAAYEAMAGWEPTSRKDLLAAHGLLMAGLVDDAGKLRTSGVGVYCGDQLVHMAPPADLVPSQMNALLDWLKRTDEHPVVASCIFHYELEFIHPFADGNGRMGRLWQTLILSRWKPFFLFLPVETVIWEKQQDYYRVLAEADKRADAAPFVEYMLEALLNVIRDAVASDQVRDQVRDQVARVIKALAQGEAGSSNLMNLLGLSHRPTFRKNYLDQALAGGWIEQTQPDSPRSPTQRYRLTVKGRLWLQRNSVK